MKNVRIMVFMCLSGCLFLSTTAFAGVPWDALTPAQQAQLRTVKHMWDKIPQNRQLYLINAVKKNGAIGNNDSPQLKSALKQEQQRSIAQEKNLQAKQASSNANKSTSTLNNLNVSALSPAEQQNIANNWSSMPEQERLQYLAKIRHLQVENQKRAAALSPIHSNDTQKTKPFFQFN